MSDKISANMHRDNATSARLDDEVATVTDDLGANLDQRLAHASQRHGSAVFDTTDLCGSERSRVWYHNTAQGIVPS
jgi:hypothetical protein